MKTTKKIISLLIALIMIFPAWISIPSEAAGNDAMTAINSSLASYKQGSTIEVADDGYIGIPVDVSVFFDKANNTAKSGHNGTPVIIYVVNTNIERVGTDSDVSIITSMLNRGYIVVVFDYKNNIKATGQPLEWSVQEMRVNVKNKTYLKDSCFPAGTYYDNYMVPAGYDVSLNNVYWEMDKHASAGTFDLLVNNWNTDFRNIKGDKLVKWVHEDGTRKTTLSGAQWFNASGASDADGEYTKVKYTVAENITDCVKPDGSPLDLNQSMSIVYPTNPANKVPVYCMASSSEYLAATPQVADRVHFNGFVFRGYAGVVFEYGYFPMARDDSYGVYNGSKTTYSSAVTNDSDNYAVHMYDDKRVNTAAIRYIRYLALSQPDTFKLDTDHIGVVGNSKGGAMSFLGEKVVQSPLVANPSSYATTEELELAIDAKINSFISRRGHVGKDMNNTRYHNGDTSSYTKDGVTIDGGEIQPWLTYNGQEIKSGVQLVWASNGVSGEDISEGHSPQIVMCHEEDPWHYYGPLNEFANTCRSHNIPMLHFEVPLGHTVAYGKDKNYDLDVYEASFDFIDYYLKGSPVKVIYTNPQSGAANIGVSSPILVKFSGGVSPSEVSKITMSANGEAVTGTWKASYGNTYWEFTPDVLKGNTKYTLTVPADLKGENGVSMGTAYIADFYSEYGVNTLADSTSDITGGKSIKVTVPELNSEANSIKLRFRVINDGANIIGAYTENGTLIGKAYIKGQGYYEIDATKHLYDKAGQQVTILLKEEKAQGVTDIYTSDFANNSNKCTVAEMTSISLDTAPDSTPSLKVVKTDSGSKYTNHVIYNSSRMPAFTVSNILGFKITEADYGRKFTFKVKVYDTVSRFLQLKLNTNTHSTQEVADYDNPMYNFTTKAGEWITFSFDYAVYDTDYGKIGLKNKNLIVSVSHAGDSEAPLYISNIEVDETVTGISMDNIYVALENDGGNAFKAPEEDSIFTLYNGDVKVAGYNTLKDAFGAYKYGYTLKLTDNYTLTDSDLYGDFATLADAKGENGHIIDINLNGYTINCENTKNSLLWLKNTSVANGKTVINLSNGTVNLKNTALISYESSTTSGNGKEFDINLNNLNIGILDNSSMDTIVSATSITSGADANVNITLNECNINVPDEKMSPEYKTVLPAGGTGLNLNYTVNGGSLSLTSQRWIKIQDKLDNCTYKKGENGKYMTLIMPSSALASSAAYMLDGVSASSFELADTKNNISTYELSAGPLSTRYGVIPEEYASVDDHPLVWFDESGTFKGSSTLLYGSSSSTSIVGLAKTYLADNKYNAATRDYGANPLGAFVVVRKDYTLGSTETYGNLAQVQGTLVIDLYGHTITQNSKPLVDSTAKRWGSSGDLAIFPTEVKWEHGTIALKNNSLVHFTAWDANASGDVADKEFTHTFEDVTIQLAEGATVSNLFTFAQNASTPTATSKAFVNIKDIKIDLETVKPAGAMTLFNAGSQYITTQYEITGSEIYADSMANIIVSTVADGSSVTAKKNENDELLKIFVQTANKATFTESKLGDATFVEADPSGTYSVFTLEEASVPVMVAATVTKYNADFQLETTNILNVLTDGSLTSNSSIIDYKKASIVSENGLNAEENAGQHWLIELDKVHTLGSVKAVYSATHKWVDFNVKVSEDNLTWTDLGTIRPEVAASNGDPVTIPLNSVRGKYIKLTVVKRNATTVDDESIAWGANLGAGCSLALYEIISISSAAEIEVDKSIETEYGIIPEEYISESTYPWVLFDENKNFLGATNDLYGANNEDSIVGKAKAYLKGNVFDTTNKTYGANEKKAYVLLRKDYTMGSTERYGNMSQIQGTITVDLGGFSIKTPSGWPLVYSQIKPWTDSGDASLFPTELKFINGTVTLGAKGLGNYETWTSSSDTTTDLTLKVFTHTYENITFTLPSGVTLTSLFTVTDKTHDAVGNVNFTDCTFDFTANALTSNLTLFKATGSKIKLNYNIKGSEIYASSMENITLSDISTGSSVIASKNSDGQYIKVFVNTENKDTFANAKMHTDSGEVDFVEWNPSSLYSVFSLQAESTSNPLLTKYGTIPSAYKDIDAYPVVWFDEKGTFKGAASELFGATSSTTSPVHLAKTYLKDNVYDATNDNYGDNEKKAYILLRKDYTMGASETYGNLTQVQGVLTIDLNGNTLIQNKNPIASAIGIRWSWSGDAAIFPTEIVIENGTVLLKDNGLAKFTAWDSNGSGDIENKKFINTYKDLTIKLAEGTTVKELFTIGQHNSTPTAKANMYVNFEDCVFDFETVTPTSMVMLPANGEYIKTNYNIKGSEIYATSMENIAISSAISSGSSVVAVQNEEDKYLKVNVAKENKATFTEKGMSVSDGYVNFIELSSETSYSVFTLYKSKPIAAEGVLTYLDKAFSSIDTFVNEEGESVTAPVGIIFGKAVEKSEDYTRTEYGVMLSFNPITVDEFKTAKNIFCAPGKRISIGNQYGIRFYGPKIKLGVTYYALPYAKYEDIGGNKVTVYGNEVIEFIPTAE